MRLGLSFTLATVLGLAAGLPVAVTDSSAEKRSEASTGIYNYYAPPQPPKMEKRSEASTGIYNYYPPPHTRKMEKRTEVESGMSDTIVSHPHLTCALFTIFTSVTISPEVRDCLHSQSQHSNPRGQSHISHMTDIGAFLSPTTRRNVRTLRTKLHGRTS